MSWLGEELSDQSLATPQALPFSSRCTKDLIEEELFSFRRDLFSGVEMVFFDTTSLYFEGRGGQKLGRRGHSKDHRSDLHQMVVGVVLDERGRPLCCVMWPGNTADVNTLIPVMERIKHRFGVEHFCVVADRGMISKDSIESLVDEQHNLTYILGARIRKVSEIKEVLFSHQDLDTYTEVHPQSPRSKAPAPLRVKEVWVGPRRYILSRIDSRETSSQGRRSQRGHPGVLAREDR